MDAEVEERGHGVVLDKHRSEISRHMSAGFGTQLAFKASGEAENARGQR
jgi:hypothetical protein